MNQYERAFADDVRQKKITASGARHRASRNPKHGGPIRTPSDYLTAKQRKELNGPVTTVILKPMTWKEFKTFSDAEKKLYLKLIQENFCATTGMAAAMFGVSDSHVAATAKKVGTPFPRINQHQVTPEVEAQRASFAVWVNNDAETSFIVNDDDDETTEAPAASDNITSEYKPDVSTDTPKEQAFNLYEINTLSRIIIEAAGLKVTIEK